MVDYQQLILEPEAGNSETSLYFLSLLVFFLSLYSVKARSVQIDIAKREKLNTDEQ